MLQSLISNLAASLDPDVELLDEYDKPGDWLRAYFPAFVTAPFAPHHHEFWAWVWALQRNVKPAPFIAIWPRGGAKTTSAELTVPMVAARGARRYVLYVRGTQDQANMNVQNIASLLESSVFAAAHPRMANPRVGKHGNRSGWRRNRLWTQSGLVVDAYGLDTALRGAKVENVRPDFIIFDDIDGKFDTENTTEKKIGTITHSILPAGSTDSAVLGVQNLIIPRGVFGRLASGEADFLRNRIMSGPHPAAHDLTYEYDDKANAYVVTGGAPTWQGQDLPTIEGQINEWGPTAFEREAQHDVTVLANGVFAGVTFAHCTPEEVPGLVRICAWVDPAVTKTDTSDSQAIQIDGIAADGTIYRLWSWEQQDTPLGTIKRAIRHAVRLHATKVGVETDQGGDTWEVVYNSAVAELRAEGFEFRERVPEFDQEKAGSIGSKMERWQKMLADGYERHRVIHVRNGSEAILEAALRRAGDAKPFDLADAAFWSWYDLHKEPYATDSSSLLR